MIALIVHGGCGIWLPRIESAASEGCRQAVEEGKKILLQGGSALEAVMASCVELENNPVFNAGTGSVLNYDGNVQMDASFMEGDTLRFGAVGAIERVKNPILVAQRVVEKTDHNILVGAGAVEFARKMDFADYDPRTEERIAEYQALRAKVPDGELKVSQFISGHPEHAYSLTMGSSTMGTVGAVALDSYGHLAAATTTGGMPLKLPGRLGDTPLPGGGTYATAHSAASSTGPGESVMRILGAREVCDLIDSGCAAQLAVDQTLQRIQTLFGMETGLIALDECGRVGIAHRTPEMPHAFFVGDRATIARIRNE